MIFLVFRFNCVIFVDTKKEYMSKHERYETLVSDIKYQTKLMSDVYEFDFNYFNNIVEEAHQLQIEILNERNEINESYIEK